MSNILLRGQNKKINLKIQDFLKNEDTFPKYFTQNTKETDDHDNVDGDYLTLLHSNDFFSEVVNKVKNNTPFLFQIDKDNFNIDSFIIGKFIGDFKFKQKNYKIWSVSLTIREVW